MLLQQKGMRDGVQHGVDNYSTMTGRLSNFPYKTCNLQDLLRKKEHKLWSATPDESQFSFTLY